jgi:DNA polymerase-3 subunit delta
VNIRPDELSARLARKLEPLYVIQGDEPLLVLEAGDAIRNAARAAGIVERDVLVADAGFKWDAFVGANANLALFGERKLVDLRIPTGKPGTEGGKALEAFAASPNRDNLTLITLPRADRTMQNAAWFLALARIGATIAVYPPEREALPGWIARRLARQSQTATPETLAFLADHCEGNLIAARQEIEKLALLLPAGALDHDAVVAAVADVARYDVFAVSEAWLSGDAGRVLRILTVLEGEGDGPQLAIWSLSEDLHALAAVQAIVQQGVPMAVALREAHVWGRRQSVLERAARRVAPADVERWLAALARVDALGKGVGQGNAWDQLTALALDVAGKPARPLATIR